MAITFGFYNSVNNDRRYDATQMSSIFDGIITDGVFMSIGTALMVEENSGMSVKVGIGRAWFNHTWTNVDAEFILPIDISEIVVNRIDAVVLEVNSSDSVRTNSIKVIKGTPTLSPSNPVMINSETLHQHPLAYIYVGVGVTSITTANITNAVGTGACPFVTGILETMDIDGLIAEWGAQWEEWVLNWDAWELSQAGNFTTWMGTQEGAFSQWFADIQDRFGDGTISVVPAGISFTGDITPPTITSDQDNYDPIGLSTASTLRLSTDASHNITGIAGGSDGRIMIAANIGESDIVLKHNGSSSIGANRFIFANATDTTLAPNQDVMLQYDATSTRWRLIGGTGSGSGGASNRSWFGV